MLKKREELLPLERRQRRTAARLRWPEAEGVRDAESLLACLVFVSCLFNDDSTI